MKPGTRLKSTVCETEVVVIRSLSASVSIECGGAPMGSDSGDRDQGPRDGLAGGTLIGKRYTDEDSGLLVLCTKGGAGTLTVDGRPLQLLAAQLLPSSD
jgi:hypothetical protein